MWIVHSKITVLFHFCIDFPGSDDEKGKVMGIFRSIGALARAVGPFLSCLGKH